MKALNTTLILVGLLILTYGTCIAQISEVQYKDWNYGCAFKLNASEAIIINTEEEFKQYTNCLIWNFDFDQHTIIGLGGIYCANSSDVITRILRDNKQRKYIVEVNFYNYKPSITRVARYGTKRIIYTDKLQPDYEIVFETKYICGMKENIDLNTHNPQEEIHPKRSCGLFPIK